MLGLFKKNPLYLSPCPRQVWVNLYQMSTSSLMELPGRNTATWGIHADSGQLAFEEGLRRNHTLTVRGKALPDARGRGSEENRGPTGKICRKPMGSVGGGGFSAEAQRRGPSHRKPPAGRCTGCAGRSWQAQSHGAHLACSCPGCWN